jgi:DNA-binding transcriptional regulator PaaX
MKDSELEKLIHELPAGLDRAVLRVLSFHPGRSNAIGRGALIGELKTLGFKVHERQVRAQINQLRKNGMLIGSAAGEQGGYFICTNIEEFEEFANAEFRSKLADMQDTLSTMQKAAEKKWGRYSPEKQLSML